MGVKSHLFYRVYNFIIIKNKIIEGKINKKRTLFLEKPLYYRRFGQSYSIEQKQIGLILFLFYNVYFSVYY
jgi:hypothetical protein